MCLVLDSIESNWTCVYIPIRIEARLTNQTKLITFRNGDHQSVCKECLLRVFIELKQAKNNCQF